MITKAGSRVAGANPCRGSRARVRITAGVIGMLAAWSHWGRGGEAETSLAARYYSTAGAPAEYRGPRPFVMARNESTAANPEFERVLDRVVAPAGVPDSGTPGAQAAPATSAAERPTAPKLASTAIRPVALSPARVATPASPAATLADDPIANAKQAIAACQARFAQVRDYTCTFHKRERIDGRLTAPHVMNMKARSNPHSVYFKFVWPNKGREAIYVAGRNGGRIVAHDVGIGKLFAGTMHLDPKGSMAMEANRHPVTDAGIGSLIETVARHWATELTPEDTQVAFHPNVRVGNHPCTVIETTHPRKHANLMFHKVKLYIDHEHGLPIRFEAYDWPKYPGARPELVEEYTYMNLRTNTGLREHDFDPANSQYSFGRF